MKKVITSILILLIIAIGAYAYVNRNTPLHYWVYSPQTFLECIEASNVFYETYPESCTFRGKTFKNVDAFTRNDDTSDASTNDSQSQTSDWHVYRNTEAGFKIEHPDGWVAAEREQFIDFFTDPQNLDSKMTIDTACAFVAGFENPDAAVRHSQTKRTFGINQFTEYKTFVTKPGEPEELVLHGFSVTFPSGFAAAHPLARSFSDTCTTLSIRLDGVTVDARTLGRILSSFSFLN
jgi:hypothetical protein